MTWEQITDSFSVLLDAPREEYRMIGRLVLRVLPDLKENNELSKAAKIFVSHEILCFFFKNSNKQISIFTSFSKGQNFNVFVNEGMGVFGKVINEYLEIEPENLNKKISEVVTENKLE